MDASAGAREMTAIALRKGCTVAFRFLRCRPILDSVLDGCGSPASLYSIVIAFYVLLRSILDVSSYDASCYFSCYLLNTIRDGVVCKITQSRV